MSLLDDRKNAFENKFAHDTELQFKVESRRNKLIALWAGDEDVFRKISCDLGDRVTADEIKTKMSKLLAIAKSQVMESSD